MRSRYSMSLGLVGAGIAVSLFAAAGRAAETPAAVEAQGVATNLPDVRAFVAAPAKFDPLTASPADLDRYGFPPRPDAKAAPAGYAAWARAVTTAAKVIVPVLKPTNIYHGPVKNIHPAKGVPAGSIVPTTSGNWSGIIIQDSNNPFTEEAIEGNFIVPVGQLAFGAPCNSSTDTTVYMSEWVGIDGAGSLDVLQDGIAENASCIEGTTSANYYAWYEWYPNGEVQISNFAVSPGDDMFVEVWNTSSTAGRAYLINYTANTKVAITFSAPSGTSLLGNSIEWVVEAPGIDDSQSSLENYVATAFSDDLAYNYAGSPKAYYYPGVAPTGTIYNCTMTDGESDPISYAVLGGSRDIWFYDEGTARNSPD